MGDFVSVGLDTSEFVGIDDNVGSNCNCSEEEEEPEDELSIVGNSVVSLSLKVGLGDNSKLVGADDDTGNSVEVNSVGVVGNFVVIVDIKVGLEDSKIVGGLDCEDDPVVDVLSLDSVLPLKVGLGVDISSIVGNCVVLLKYVDGLVERVNSMLLGACDNDELDSFDDEGVEDPDEE